MRTGSSSRASDRAAPPADRWGRALLAGAVLAGLAGGARHLLPGPRPRAAAAPETVVRVAAPRPAPPRSGTAATVHASASAGADAPLPASLHGTTEDGALRVDDDGNLVLGPEVLRFFDYWLSATGEESAASIRARITAAIHRRLPGEPARGQAVALLATYLDYREATRRLRPEGDDPRARLEAVARLRRRSFGAAAAEALFGDEERALAVALDQRKLLTDATLPQDERDRRASELEARLPEAVRAARAEATRPLRERAEEDGMRAAGASDDDVRAYRVATHGEEAADRLAELDRRRAEWRRRLAAFREARATLARDQPDPALRRAAVRQLLEASFTPLEQIRVEAVDPLE